jgi:hypothetical protein
MQESSLTLQQYDKVIALCKDIFVKKMHDYGSAWRVLRVSSIADQIFIKAERIRTIQEKGIQRIDDGIQDELTGIVNYAIMGCIQLEAGPALKADLDAETALQLFDRQVQKARHLMENKNHDYNEAWRKMRISSITDLILMKVLRLKQIENHQGKTLVSEGMESNFLDIINYAVFALILSDADN